MANYPGIPPYNDSEEEKENYEANQQKILQEIVMSPSKIDTNVYDNSYVSMSPAHQFQAIISKQHYEIRELRDNLDAAYDQIHSIQDTLKGLSNTLGWVTNNIPKEVHALQESMRELRKEVYLKYPSDVKRSYPSPGELK